MPIYLSGEIKKAVPEIKLDDLTPRQIVAELDKYVVGQANAKRAVAALKTAQANVSASRALLAQSQTQRQRAIIRSPVNGVVLARQVDPGQTVAASFNTPTLFVIAEDLSKMKLTHHTLRSGGKAAMSLSVGEKPLLAPVTEAGSGSVQAREKAYLSAIIEKLNTLFEGDLTDDDQLVYVNHVIMGKLLESSRLVQQATNNTKEQFANSPDLRTELRNALMEALDAHTSMSSQALNSETVQAGIPCSGPFSSPFSVSTVPSGIVMRMLIVDLSSTWFNRPLRTWPSPASRISRSSLLCT